MVWSHFNRELKEKMAQMRQELHAHYNQPVSELKISKIRQGNAKTWHKAIERYAEVAIADAAGSSRGYSHTVFTYYLLAYLRAFKVIIEDRDNRLCDTLNIMDSAIYDTSDGTVTLFDIPLLWREAPSTNMHAGTSGTFAELRTRLNSIAGIYDQTLIETIADIYQEQIQQLTRRGAKELAFCVYQLITAGFITNQITVRNDAFLNETGFGPNIHGRLKAFALDLSNLAIIDGFGDLSLASTRPLGLLAMAQLETVVPSMQWVAHELLSQSGLKNQVTQEGQQPCYHYYDSIMLLEQEQATMPQKYGYRSVCHTYVQQLGFKADLYTRTALSEIDIPRLTSRFTRNITEADLETTKASMVFVRLKAHYRGSEYQLQPSIPRALDLYPFIPAMISKKIQHQVEKEAAETKKISGLYANLKSALREYHYDHDQWHHYNVVKELVKREIQFLKRETMDAADVSHYEKSQLKYILWYYDDQYEPTLLAVKDRSAHDVRSHRRVNKATWKNQVQSLWRTHYTVLCRDNFAQVLANKKSSLQKLQNNITALDVEISRVSLQRGASKLHKEKLEKKIDGTFKQLVGDKLKNHGYYQISQSIEQKNSCSALQNFFKLSREEQRACSYEGASLLSYAVIYQDFDVVSSMLHHYPELISHKDVYGWQPLHYIVRTSSNDAGKKTLKLLLEQGASLEQRVGQEQANVLHLAVRQLDVEMLVELLKCPTSRPLLNESTIDHHRETPLQLAMRIGHSAMILKLCNAGAMPQSYLNAGPLAWLLILANTDLSDVNALQSLESFKVSTMHQFQSLNRQIQLLVSEHERFLSRAANSWLANLANQVCSYCQVDMRVDGRQKLSELKPSYCRNVVTLDWIGPEENTDSALTWLAEHINSFENLENLTLQDCYGTPNEWFNLFSALEQSPAVNLKKFSLNNPRWDAGHLQFNVDPWVSLAICLRRMQAELRVFQLTRATIMDKDPSDQVIQAISMMENLQFLTLTDSLGSETAVDLLVRGIRCLTSLVWVEFGEIATPSSDYVQYLDESRARMDPAISELLFKNYVDKSGGLNLANLGLTDSALCYLWDYFVNPSLTADPKCISKIDLSGNPLLSALGINYLVKELAEDLLVEPSRQHYEYLCDIVLNKPVCLSGLEQAQYRVAYYNLRIQLQKHRVRLAENIDRMTDTDRIKLIAKVIEPQLQSPQGVNYELVECLLGFNTSRNDLAESKPGLIKKVNQLKVSIAFMRTLSARVESMKTAIEELLSVDKRVSSSSMRSIYLTAVVNGLIPPGALASDKVHHFYRVLHDIMQQTDFRRPQLDHVRGAFNGASFFDTTALADHSLALLMQSVNAAFDLLDGGNREWSPDFVRHLFIFIAANLNKDYYLSREFVHATSVTGTDGSLLERIFAQLDAIQAEMYNLTHRPSITGLFVQRIVGCIRQELQRDLKRAMIELGFKQSTLIEFSNQSQKLINAWQRLVPDSGLIELANLAPAYSSAWINKCHFDLNRPFEYSFDGRVSSRTTLMTIACVNSDIHLADLLVNYGASPFCVENSSLVKSNQAISPLLAVLTASEDAMKHKKEVLHWLGLQLHRQKAINHQIMQSLNTDEDFSTLLEANDNFIEACLEIFYRHLGLSRYRGPQDISERLIRGLSYLSHSLFELMTFSRNNNRRHLSIIISLFDTHILRSLNIDFFLSETSIDRIKSIDYGLRKKIVNYQLTLRKLFVETPQKSRLSSSQIIDRAVTARTNYVDTLNVADANVAESLNVISVTDQYIDRIRARAGQEREQGPTHRMIEGEQRTHETADQVQKTNEILVRQLRLLMQNPDNTLEPEAYAALRQFR